MSRRGTCYKQYEHDSSIPIPKSTTHNRRKRQIVEANQDGDEETQLQSQAARLEVDTQFHHQVNNSPELESQWIENEVGGSGDIFDDYEFNDHHEDYDVTSTSDDGLQTLFDGGEEPIYPGANITRAQSVLLILSFLLRHSLTGEALKDLLLLLNTFFPNTVPSSPHKFYKAFRMDIHQIHFYCSSCKTYMGEDQKQRQCEACQEPFCGSSSIKKGNFFLYIPIEQQMKTLLSDVNIFNELTNRTDLNQILDADTINDVTTSQLYKELISHHGFTANDFSLTWNTDGIPIFRSSKYSIWPLQASVNELPPHLRTQHMLLIGLWFGEKPCMNSFLKPFVSECTQLQEQGFYFSSERQPRKVYPLCFCGDAPARAIVRNSKQFNGQYGCDWCESPGVTIATNAGPPPRYYPHRPPVVPRTGRKQAQYALRATEQNPIKGVKGITVVDTLPSFEIVRGIGADYMHSVCLGVTKHFTNLWLDSKNHEEEYYIGRKIPMVDDRLKEICPPSEMHRAPRSLNERHYWKASEWRAFLLYSLVVLQGILPLQYLKHLFLYVYGVYTLLGDCITTEGMANAEACLLKFVVQVEHLYGLKHCTFNVHCLTHLAQCVRDCGPLWSTSAFSFEAHNHSLLKMFNGTQYVPQQITEQFLTRRAVSLLTRLCIDENSSSAVIDVLNKLNHNTKFGKTNACEGFATLGVEKQIQIGAREVLALQDLLNVNVSNRCAVLYERFVQGYQVFSSVNYTRAKRHTNFSVLCEDGGYGTILGLLKIKPECQCGEDIEQYCQCNEHSVVLIKPVQVNSSCIYKDRELGVASHFLLEVVNVDSIKAIMPSQIIRKCIFMVLGDKTFFCPLPYRIYGD